MTIWSDDELRRIGEAEELELASARSDGTFRHPVVMWVVRHGDDIYVAPLTRRSMAAAIPRSSRRALPLKHVPRSGSSWQARRRNEDTHTWTEPAGLGDRTRLHGHESELPADPGTE